jgi:hypothetical protein
MGIQESNQHQQLIKSQKQRIEKLRKGPSRQKNVARTLRQCNLVERIFQFNSILPSSFTITSHLVGTARITSILLRSRISLMMDMSACLWENPNKNAHINIFLSINIVHMKKHPPNLLSLINCLWILFMLKYVDTKAAVLLMLNLVNIFRHVTS